MPKIQRNEPCPCGSGKKYKKCCLGRDEAVAEEHRLQHSHDFVSRGLVAPADAEQIDELSNAANDFIRAGRFEEAERACRQLRERFPQYIDGFDRTAELYEARGERAPAADWYRRALAFTYEHPGFDDDCRRGLLSDIRRLDPDGPLPDLPITPSRSR